MHGKGEGTLLEIELLIKMNVNSGFGYNMTFRSGLITDGLK
jgi:hypothetical protein